MIRLTSLESLFCDIVRNQSRRSLDNTLLYRSLRLVVIFQKFPYHLVYDLSGVLKE